MMASSKCRPRNSAGRFRITDTPYQIPHDVLQHNLQTRTSRRAATASVPQGWTYLYRAVDSAGETIEFMLSPKRDLMAAKMFLRLALSAGGPQPRVINVDGHPAYPSAIAELKQSGELGRRCRCRTAPYLNNALEQDHRFINKRVTASLGFRSVEGACRTTEGYEAMHAIRKGQVRWVPKGDPVAQRQSIHTIFGIPA
jgi:IS6 family transposase